MADVQFSFNSAKPWHKIATNVNSIVDLGTQIIEGSLLADNIQAPYPMSCFGPLEEIENGLAFMPFFGNITIIDTKEGLVLIDGGGLGTKIVHQQIRNWKPNSPFHTGIYTHGHIDHVHGIKAIEKIEKYKFRLQVIGHRNVRKRFDRYAETRRLNATINLRQFQSPSVGWPKTYRYPDIEYEDHLKLNIGGEEIHLYHDRGETDDGTWIWLPNRSTICTGDLIIWSFPNCGNPQKSQRYCKEWANALRKMEDLKPELLLPGHGPPIKGRHLVQSVLNDTALALELIFNQTMDYISKGMRLEDVIENVKIPKELLAKPYLVAQYDQIDFIIRNIWRLHSGWWDGNPAHLEPVHSRILGKEIINLVGREKLITRVKSLVKQPTKDNLAIASQLLEYLKITNPTEEVKDLYKSVYELRSNNAKSTMATGIYSFSSKSVTKQGEEYIKILSKI